MFGAKSFEKHQSIPSLFPPHLDFPPVLVSRFLASHLWRDPHQTEVGVDSCSLCRPVRRKGPAFFMNPWEEQMLDFLKERLILTSEGGVESGPLASSFVFGNQCSRETI